MDKRARFRFKGAGGRRTSRGSRQGQLMKVTPLCRIVLKARCGGDGAGRKLSAIKTNSDGSGKPIVNTDAPSFAASRAQVLICQWMFGCA